MKRKLVTITLTLVAVLGFSGVFSTVANADAFNANNLIDDTVFDDTNTMSAAQIDAFLNGFPNSCISPNSGFAAIDPTGYNPSSGFQYGGYVSAGQVIYDAAQAYGINPQVLLTTLQKEQSLVIGSTNFCENGSMNKYAAAVGYGCPDSGTTYSYTGVSLYRRNGVVASNTGTTCVNSAAKAGFSQQVIRGAWLLKFGEQRSEGNLGWAVIKGNWDNSDDPQTCYGGPMTQGTRQRCPSGGSAFYDGYTTIDSTAVHMDNGATAALYWYTPHFHGNQNFDTIFQAYFGSIIGSYLVRSTSDSTVYLLSGTNKYPIADQGVFNDFNPLGAVKFVSSAYLDGYTTGSVLGHMVGGPDGTLYFVDAGYKLGFTSCSQVVAYGYNCASVINLSTIQLNKLATGPNMTSVYKTTNGKTFYVTAGQKREALDQQSLTQAGVTDAANVLLDRGLSYLPYGSPVIRDDVVVANRDSGKKYLYEASKFYELASDISTLSYIKALPAGSMDDSSIPMAQRDTSFTGFVKNSSTAYYLLTGSGKALLTDNTQWVNSYTVMSDNLLNAIPNASSPINNLLVKSPTDATVYYIGAAKKRPIPGWGDLLALNITPLEINTIPDSSLNALATGPTMYGPGDLVKTADSDTVYIVKDGSNLFPISSFVFPQEIGLSLPLRTINNSDFQTYTILPAIKTQLQCGAVYYIGNKGQVNPIASSSFTDYGFSSGQFIDAGAICSTLSIRSQSMGAFILVTNGTIFQVSGGQKLPIVGYAKYISLGGNASNTTPVSDYLASLIPTGSTIH